MNRLMVRILCLAVSSKVILSASIFDSKNVDFPRASVNISQYKQERDNLLNSEIQLGFGSEIVLNEKEQAVNRIVMKAKEDELKIGIQSPHLFNPSRHIFEVLDAIKDSKLFQIIKKMPKGGILHIHLAAMCSTDFVMSLTYWPHLWQRTLNKSDEIVEFKFSREQPKRVTSDSVWRPVKDVRNEVGSAIYDKHVRRLFTLYDKNDDPRTLFKNANEVWQRFYIIFLKISPILLYAPVHRAFFKQALKEMYEDGVQYLEFKTSLIELYDLDGNIYSKEDIFDQLITVLDEFKRENPMFIGSKLIYSPSKKLLNETAYQKFKKLSQTLRKLHEKYPQFLAGFDLVGKEDALPGLLTFAEPILQLPSDLKFFFHAGETNWWGSIDENLVDAILLGSHRIGHGYALNKHPKLLELVKSKNIAIEVNPISNQVLKLVDDFRNHPASVFMAKNVSIVVSSDDPSFWEVSPLTHDFYITFLGIASRHSDLRVLKKLAINSIQYSSMNDLEKSEAFVKWQTKWDQFIEDLVKNQ